MSFQEILKIEKPDFYLDIAFRKATEYADKLRSSKTVDRLGKSKYIEIAKLQTIGRDMATRLTKVLKSFPSIDNLTPFYLELIKCTMDYGLLKKSLGGLNWAINNIDKITSSYIIKIKKTREIPKVNEYRKEYYGRVSSFIKQIKKELEILEESRRIMKDFPVIKSGLKTYAIAGFPNVGKTTLLYKLTGSKPKISAYSFTTKEINVSYVTNKKEKIQFLDTPGTLNRFNKMNNIEKIAYLAIKLVADKMIYVFDLTECYPLNDQIKLYENLKKENKEILIYLSKTDIIDKEIVSKFKKKFDVITDPKKLKL